MQTLLKPRVGSLGRDIRWIQNELEEGNTIAASPNYVDLKGNK